jgi:FAD/FMN-containing dehydrogenase
MSKSGADKSASPNEATPLVGDPAYADGGERAKPCFGTKRPFQKLWIVTSSRIGILGFALFAFLAWHGARPLLGGLEEQGKPLPEDPIAGASNTDGAHYNLPQIRLQLQLLQQSIKGRVFVSSEGIETSESPDFVNASYVWNQVTFPPLAVVQVADEEDVITVLPYLIALQQDYGIPFRIRSGGHQYAGWSGIANGIILALDRLNRILDFDTTTGLATFGPVVRVQDILREILVKRGYGSVIGFCPTVAEGGYIMGGGMGLLARQHGLGLDNLKAARVVLADGQVVECSADENAELFWALRGAGQGNFGVVTQMTSQFYPYPDEFFMSGGFVAVEDMAHFLYRVAELEREIPGSVGGYFSSDSSMQNFSVGFWYNGVNQEELRKGEGILKATTTLLSPREDTFLAPERTSWYNLSMYQVPRHEGNLVRMWNGYLYRERNSLSACEEIVESIWAALRSTDHGLFGTELWGGAIADKKPTDTAFYWRQGVLLIRFTLIVPASLPDARKVYEEDAVKINHLWQNVAKHLNGTYMNYAEADLTGVAAWRTTYGGNLEHLVSLKQRLDPRNVFNHPHSLPVYLPNQ